MTEPIDYCSRCTTSCCSPLLGLKVTREEYETAFSGRDGNLAVTDMGAFLQVSAGGDGACPNFIDRKCSIYEKRPVECRLYPYSIYAVLDHDDHIRAYVHGGTETCPFKYQLLPSENEIRALMDRFLDAAFPRWLRRLVIELNPNFNVLRIRRVHARIRNEAVRLVRRVWPEGRRRQAG
jgi:Fe-S-cluster containining protein